jgi:WD40 repeat protein
VPLLFPWLPLQCRYQIHSGHVSALDCAADGATMVSGGADGHIVLWSHVTGFKLATFTLHSTAIKSLAFNFGKQLAMQATLVVIRV